MNKACFLIPALLCAPILKAQGTITYFNSGIDGPGGTTYDAPIFIPFSSTRMEGPAYTAGLFFNGLLVPGSAQPFLTGGGAGLFNPVFDLPIPGAAPGSTPTLQVRVWNTSAGSYDNAVITGQIHGQSNPFIAPPLGGINPNPPPPSFTPGTLTGLQSFAILPEPSTYALGVFSLAILAAVRRRRP